MGAFVAGAARLRDARWYTGPSFILIGYMGCSILPIIIFLYLLNVDVRQTFGTGSYTIFIFDLKVIGCNRRKNHEYQQLKINRRNRNEKGNESFSKHPH